MAELIHRVQALQGMMRSLHLEVEGDVSESQELLDGTRQVVLVGSAEGDENGAWDFTLTLAWPMGAETDLVEGDLTLSRDDGAEMFGNLRAGRYREAGGGGVQGAAESFEAAFEIDGGEGEFAGVRGSVNVTGTFTRARFAATADVRLPAGGQG